MQFYRHFIPHIENNHRPSVLRHKNLLVYAALLILLQLFLSFTPLSGPKVIASTISTDAIINLSNSARSSAGIFSLRVNGALNLAAQNKAVHMLQNNYWADNAPDGTTPWQFISSVGYNYLYAGENLARDFVTPNAVVDAWMASKTHRNNLLNTQYKDMGVAVVEGTLQGTKTILVVQMFGKKVQASSSYSASAQNNTSDITPPNPPEIQKPKDGATTNDLRLEVVGSSEAGSGVGVFDGEEKLGSLPADDEGSFTYKIEKDLDEGDHTLSADATDAAGNTSLRSKKVNVEIDITPAKIIRKSLQITSNVSNLGAQYFISVKLEEKAEAVLASVADYSALLEPLECEVETTHLKVLAKTNKLKSCFIYSGSFIPPQSAINEAEGKISITSFDKAGNIDEYSMKLPSGIALAASNLVNNSFLKRFFENPQSTLINIYFVVTLAALFIVDSLVIFRKKIIRQNSHSSAHFLLLLTVILMVLLIQRGSIV